MHPPKSRAWLSLFNCYSDSIFSREEQLNGNLLIFPTISGLSLSLHWIILERKAPEWPGMRCFLVRTEQVLQVFGNPAVMAFWL